MNNSIHQTLGRIEAEVSACRQDIAHMRDSNENRLGSHSERIGSLENSRARGKGARYALVFVLTTLLGYLGWEYGGA